MRILVIDDSLIHRNAAEEQIEGHDLTVVGTYSDALKEFDSDDSYEVALVDLLMPACEFGEPVGEEIPIGIFLALLAAKHGARYVAVHTDSDHHSHPASACFDDFNPPAPGKSWGWGEDNPTTFSVEGAKVLLSNNRNWIEDGVKRWDLLLEYLLEK